MCDTHSEQINELAKALAAAQGELEPAEKNATAAIGEKGKLSRKYADLTAMIDAVRKVLPKHGLSIAQIVLPTEGVAHVRTMLMHESGQWLASECRMPYDNTGSKNTVQSMGSAITYARRYSLSALVGVVADDDDDGEGAWRRDADREQPRRNAPEPAPQPKPIVDLGEECHDEKSEQIRAFLKGLLEHMDSAAEVKVYESEKGRYKVFLEGEKLGALIGRRGETLDAIQQLTNYSINRGSEKNRARVQVDAENYREKREQSLERLAEKVAGKVTKYRRNVTLEPMNAYERHVIHTALQDTPSVTTFSIGTEPNRRVVVSYDRTKA